MSKNKGKVAVLPKIVENRPLMSSSGQQTKKYQIGKELGKGGFAECYLAIEVGTNKEYAIKVISKTSENMTKEGAKARLHNEIVLMAKLKHQNIVKLIQNFEDEHNYYLLLELCSKLNLGRLLDRRSKLLEIQIKFYIRQLVSAALYLKQKRVIHRDIKLQNILLDEKLNIKLADFGLAISADTVDRNTSICGTPSYIAPEVIKKESYSFEVDMWSIGVVTFMLLFLCHPFSAPNPKPRPKQKKQVDKYMKQCHNLIYDRIKKIDYRFPQITKIAVSSTARDFIKKIFVLDPLQRLSVEEALCHQFLTQSIPQYLPIQCYDKEVKNSQLLCFCRNQKPPVFKTKKTRNINRSALHNRTITSYLIRNGSDRNIFRTVKKAKDNTDKILDQISGLNPEQNGSKIQKQQIKLFEIQMSESLNKTKKQCSQPQLAQLPAQSPGAIQQKCQKNEVQPNYFVEKSDQLQKQGEHQNVRQNIKHNMVDEDENLLEFVNNRLNGEPFIINYKDYSQCFGICLTLSNFVVVLVFNDRTTMAMCLRTKTVVYVKYVCDKLQACERLMYKLLSSKPQSQGSSIPKYTLQPQSRPNPKHQIIEFKAPQIPKQIDIIKKYYLLRNYSRSIPGYYQIKSSSISESVNLVDCAKIIHRWGCQKKSLQYFFVSKFYTQIFFPDGNCFFVVNNHKSILLVNLDSKWKKEIQAASSKKNGELSNSEVKQMEAVRRIYSHFQKSKIGKEKERTENK